MGYHMTLYNVIKKKLKGFKADSDNPILYIHNKIKNLFLCQTYYNL